jgi:polyphosphate glucokinase
MNILAIDVGGTNLKVLATGQEKRRAIKSGKQMTARRMVSEAKRLAKDWKYDVVSIGYPGPVFEGQPIAEPRNLANGWVEFDFNKAFACPVRIMNDAAMQALGSYKHGKMLFLGLGTGLGACLVMNGKVVPMEVAHLPYKRGTYEDYVGRRRLEQCGRTKWSNDVAAVVAQLTSIMHLDDVVLGGGNAKKLTVIPKGCRLGSNANAFLGGFRMWDDQKQFRKRKPSSKELSR